MPFIQTIAPENAQDELKLIYDQLLKSRGKIANVHQIQSLHPSSIRSHMELYKDIMFSKSPVGRANRELIAVIVSRTNRCEYCMNHHGEALLAYWKDQEKLDYLLKGKEKMILNEKELAISELAQKLTKKPYSKKIKSLNQNLRNMGFGDRALLDIHLVVDYFNFVNRLVLGLEVELEDEGGKGYQY